jgi:hypothetical protein
MVGPAGLDGKLYRSVIKLIFRIVPHAGFERGAPYQSIPASFEDAWRANDRRSTPSV